MKQFLLFINVVFCVNLNAQCYPDRHSTNWFDAWISCQEKENPNPVNKAGHWILFDLKNQYEIDKIKFWNINDPDRLNWGMKDVLIDYSIDSILWANAGTFSLQQGEGSNRYEGMDWTDVVIPKARYVLISGLSNYGGSCSGFAEIRFSAEKINIVTDNTEVNNPTTNALDIKIQPNSQSTRTKAPAGIGQRNSSVKSVSLLPFAAARIISSTKLRSRVGDVPAVNAMRTTAWAGFPSTTCSASAFVFPYTLSGRRTSVST